MLVKLFGETPAGPGRYSPTLAMATSLRSFLGIASAVLVAFVACGGQTSSTSKGAANLAASGMPESDAAPPYRDLNGASDAGCESVSDAGDAGCEQQLDDGGSSVPQLTCAAMTASPPRSAAISGKNSTVVLVTSTTSDDFSSEYDLGLPAGTPVCFVAMAGQFTVELRPPPVPGVDASASKSSPYSFAIYTESPWRVTEIGTAPTLPTPGCSN
jgi:hypothetical protein